MLCAILCAEFVFFLLRTFRWLERKLCLHSIRCGCTFSWKIMLFENYLAHCVYNWIFRRFSLFFVALKICISLQTAQKNVLDAVNGTTHILMLLGCAIEMNNHFLFGLVWRMLIAITNLLVIWSENIRKKSIWLFKTQMKMMISLISFSNKPNHSKISGIIFVFKTEH